MRAAKAEEARPAQVVAEAQAAVGVAPVVAPAADSVEAKRSVEAAAAAGP